MYAVTHKSVASAIKVIARADDSSGITGDACRRPLDLHPEDAADTRVPTGKLIDTVAVSETLTATAEVPQKVDTVSVVGGVVALISTPDRICSEVGGHR
ncbi:MAG TPA: hypothetical protein VIW24_25675 [Aldersonia sp.]